MFFRFSVNAGSSDGATVRSCGIGDKETMMTVIRSFFIFTAAVFLAATAQAHDPAGIQASAPWARATGKLAHSAVVYMVLENTGDASDRLVSASTPAAGRAELHTHIKDGNIMRMREVKSIEVGPHAKVRLQPSGLHVMLVDLKGPLKEGTHFPLTLKFEKAGEVKLEVAVKAAGAMAPMESMAPMGGGHDQGHGMGH
jgi:periplasmic copper chaperone A